MTRFALRAGSIAVLTVALLCSACGTQASPDPAATGDAAGAPAGGPAETTAGIATTNPATQAQAAPAAADLGGYVGKYPFDKMDGVSFLEAPAVRAAVTATVPDGRIRAWVFEKAGPQSPIALKDGRLLAWGCEAHNCGAHNWTIVIDPAGTAAELCYFDEGTDPGSARWYLAGGKTEMRKDSCPSGES